MLDADLVDIDFEFLGDEHGERRKRALPHLDVRRDEDDLAGAIDTQKCVRRERRIGRELVADLAACGQTKTDEQAAANRGTRSELQEIATRRRYVFDEQRFHLTPPYRWPAWMYRRSERPRPA